MKSMSNRGFVILLVVLLSFPLTTISSVKAVRDYPPPSLKIQLTSPSNKTYNQNSILINFSCQKQPDDWNIYLIEYAIEGEKKNYSGTFLDKELTGLSQLNFSKTITGIPDGTYVLTISAKWFGSLMYFNADKQTVAFTVDTKISTSSPTPTSTSTPTQDNQQTLNTETIIGIAITAAILGTVISLLTYLIKKKFPYPFRKKCKSILMDYFLDAHAFKEKGEKEGCATSFFS